MRLLLALLFVISSSPLLAAEPAPEAKDAPKETKDYVVAPKSVIQQDSSEHNRIDKNHQVNLILTGIGPSISSTLGLQYAHFLNRTQLIVIEATSGSLGSYGSVDEISGYDFEVETKSLGVHFKHFTGNSFYYRAGLDARSVDYSYRDFSNANGFWSFEGTSVAANFQIGNQWQWSNFTLGCDWIGFSAPITSSVTNRQIGSSAPSYAAESIEDDSNILVKKFHLNILRFYLGASF